MTSETAPPQTAPRSGFEAELGALGSDLAQRLRALIAAIPGRPHGPVELARSLGVDKVLGSRLLKATGNRDPIAVLYHLPGPEPLRRVLRAAGKRGVASELVSASEESVARFDDLIRREAGDRSALDAILSAWLPEARADFELRRKQAAFRAMSQLKGAAAELNFGTVLLHPSPDGAHLDVVWLFGLLGLQRLRPGAAVKFATRRLSPADGPRRPSTLEGEPVEGLDGLRLAEYSSQPLAPLDVHRVGEVVHYALGDGGYGPRWTTDLVFAEVNRAELPRFVPREAQRKRYVFAEVTPPVKVLVFDALLHEDIYTTDPQLFIYDTAFEGVANVNDAARDIDRLDLRESIQALGRGIAKFRTTEIPRYAELLQHTCAKLGWDGERFRGFRCHIDYPVYGSQVVMAFDTAQQ